MYLPSMPTPTTLAAFARGSATSKAAAVKISPHRVTIAERIYNAITESQWNAVKGLTCAEVETKLNLKHQTASARIHEMAKAGVLKATGRVRVGSEIYVIQLGKSFSQYNDWMKKRPSKSAKPSTESDLIDGLVASLPKCWHPDCHERVTVYTRFLGDHEYCDEHVTWFKATCSPDMSYTFTDAPWAPALRKVLEAKRIRAFRS